MAGTHQHGVIHKAFTNQKSTINYSLPHCSVEQYTNGWILAPSNHRNIFPISWVLPKMQLVSSHNCAMSKTFRQIVPLISTGSSLWLFSLAQLYSHLLSSFLFYPLLSSCSFFLFSPFLSSSPLLFADSSRICSLSFRASFQPFRGDPASAKAFAKFPEGIPESIGNRKFRVKSSQSSQGRPQGPSKNLPLQSSQWASTKRGNHE